MAKRKEIEAIKDRIDELVGLSFEEGQKSIYWSGEFEKLLLETYRSLNELVDSGGPSH